MSNTKPFFIVRSNGEFYDLQKNKFLISSINIDKIFILNDLNLKSEINKIFDVKLFINKHKTFLLTYTYLEQLLISINEQKISNSQFYFDIYNYLELCNLGNTKFEKSLHDFFNIVNKQNNKSNFLFLYKKEIESLFESIQCGLNILIINLSNSLSNDKFKNTIYHQITKNKSSSSIINISLFSNWESELDENAKINYPQYYINKSHISDIKISEEFLRMQVINLACNNFSKYNIIHYSHNGYYEKYYNNYFEYWNLNCLLSFNIIFNFLNFFDLKKIHNDLNKYYNDIDVFLKKYDTLTIPSIFLIDILINWKNQLEMRKNENINTKIEGINDSGTGFVKHIDKNKERKYKNTIFDLVDIIMSLIIFHDPENNIESIYLTGDKGINLFFNWYKINNSKDNISISLHNSIYTKTSILKLINQNNFFENKILKRKIISLSKNSLLLFEIKNQLIFNNKLKLIIQNYSLFDEDFFEHFIKIKKNNLNYLINPHDSVISFQIMLNNPQSEFFDNSGKNLKDFYLIEILNLYQNCLIEHYIKKTIDNMNKYFS